MLGGIGVAVAQHDGYMMFDVALAMLPSVWVWPSPMAWPISWMSTRVKFGGVRNEALRLAAF